MGVVAHPQGPPAHGTLLPEGFESSLAIGLGGEGIEVRAHLWMEGERSAGAEAWGLTCAPLPAPLTSLPGASSWRNDKIAEVRREGESRKGLGVGEGGVG